MGTGVSDPGAVTTIAQAVFWLMALLTIGELVMVIVWSNLSGGRLLWAQQTRRVAVRRMYAFVVRARLTSRRRGVRALRGIGRASERALLLVYGRHPLRLLATSVVISVLLVVASVFAAFVLGPSIADSRTQLDRIASESSPRLWALAPGTLEVVRKDAGATRMVPASVAVGTHRTPQYRSVPVRSGRIHADPGALKITQVERLKQVGIHTWEEVREDDSRHKPEVRARLASQDAGAHVAVVHMLYGTRIAPGPDVWVLGVLLLNVMFDLAGLAVVLGLARALQHATKRWVVPIGLAALATCAFTLLFSLLLYAPVSNGEFDLAVTASVLPFALVAAGAFAAACVAAGAAAAGSGDFGYLWFVPILVAFVLAGLALNCVGTFAWSVVAQLWQSGLPPLRDARGWPNLLPYLLAISCVVPMLVFGLVAGLVAALRLVSESTWVAIQRVVARPTIKFPRTLWLFVGAIPPFLTLLAWGVGAM